MPDFVQCKSGREYSIQFNTLDCTDTDGEYLFTVRLPTEFETEMLMEDLKENLKP